MYLPHQTEEWYLPLQAFVWVFPMILVQIFMKHLHDKKLIESAFNSWMYFSFSLGFSRVKKGFKKAEIQIGNQQWNVAVASFIIWVLTGHFPFASCTECNIITSQHQPFGLSAEGQGNHTPGRESFFVSFPGKSMTGNKGRNYKRWSNKIESSTQEFRSLFTGWWEQKAQCSAALTSREPSQFSKWTPGL